jgi:hypothetical protein
MDMIGAFGFGQASPLFPLVILIGAIFISRGLSKPVKKDDR